MDDYDAPDIAAQLALMAMVGIWGFLSCAAALQLATLGG
jgi:hypothetical protein